MTIRAKKFTPEVLLSAPRRSAGVPNDDGSLILYTVSTHSFDDQSTKSEVRVLSSEDGLSHLVTDVKGASEPQWIDDKVLLLLPGEKGATQIAIGDPLDFEKSKYIAGTVDGPTSNVKLIKLAKDKYAIALTSQAMPDGGLYNPEKATKPKSTGRLYHSTFVRHWDSYITPNKNTIWYGTLVGVAGDTPKQYTLSPLTNALEGTGLESPIPPFGGSDHYDLGINGIIFTGKDPNLNLSTNTKTDVWFIPIPFSKSLPPPGPAPPIVASTNGLEGATTSITFSPDGKQAAFLKMNKNGYEADKNQLIIIPDIKNLHAATVAFPSNTHGSRKGSWDYSPQSIVWSKDGKALYLTAENRGRTCLFSVSVDALPSTKPSSDVKLVQTEGNVANVRYLANDTLFISSSSLVDNSVYSTIEASDPSVLYTISSNSRHGASFGLSPEQIDEFWWNGATDGVKVHALVVKPSNFDPKKKYPLAYAIHGGPQGAWLNAWSTRWNPAVIAEQGYVVVAPNPTGSTGYGQDFCDDIHDQWGGLPYQDLVKGFEYIEKHVPYIDTDKAVALGASYGGYMINWIQGQPLGRKFKALVCHDGVFSMTGQLASEESWFPYHDLNGPLWKNPESWSRWDPSRFLANWATPQLIIHSELDYRLTISEGLSAFNVLQTKGIESQFLTFPDENHWVLNSENSLVWHTVVFDFINPKVGLPKYSDHDKLAKESKDEVTMN